MRLGYHPWNLLSEKIFKFKCLIKEYENGITISTMIRLTYWKGWFNVGKLLYAIWRNFLQSIWFSFACNSALHLGKKSTYDHCFKPLVSKYPIHMCSYAYAPYTTTSVGWFPRGVWRVILFLQYPLSFGFLFVHFTRLFMAPVSFCHCGRENLAS